MPKTIYLASTLNVALEAAEELHHVQQAKQMSLRHLSTTNQDDHEAAFLTIFNRAIKWERDIPAQYRAVQHWLDAYRRGRRDGLHAFMVRRFPYLFDGVKGTELFDEMWIFCFKIWEQGDKASKESIQDELEAMMGEMNLEPQGMEGLMAGMNWGD